MRSNCDFIEVTGIYGENKFLINKNQIVYIRKEDGEDEHAIIMIAGGERMHKVVTKESYKEVTEELLWHGWYITKEENND